MRPPQKAGPIQTSGSSLSYGLTHPSGARLSDCWISSASCEVMVHSIISVLLLLVCLDAVDGYPTGPPQGACAGMAPSTSAPPGGHGANPQSGPAPYNVTTNVPDEGAKTGNSYTGAETN